MRFGFVYAGREIGVRGTICVARDGDSVGTICRNEALQILCVWLQSVKAGKERVIVSVRAMTILHTDNAIVQHFRRNKEDMLSGMA